MSKSRFRGTSFATIAAAIVASIAVIAALAAWERSSVAVYEATPTESLLLLRAGDVVDSSVELGATRFEERAEKRIEGLDRAVLEYLFAAKDTGLGVRTQIIERPTDELAVAEAEALRAEFGGVALDPLATGSAYPLIQLQDAEGLPMPEIWRDGERILFLARLGTYVYFLETNASVASEYAVAEAMRSKLRALDARGAVLPLRAPLVAPR